MAMQRRIKKITILTVLLLVSASWSAAQRTESFPINPGSVLRFDLETGASLEIEGWERNSAEITVEGESSCPGCRFEFNPTSDGLEVKSYFDENRSQQRSSLKLFVRIPDGCEIHLDSMGGGLSAANFDGIIGGKTMGGALSFENVGGEIRMTTMGGNITLRDSEVDGKITTMGGRVIFENVRGDIRGKSMGGHVIYRNVEITSNSEESVGDEVHIETMGGGIDVEEAPKGAKVKTMGGNITIGRASQFVFATTMGGDILMESVEGEVKATTMGGDIEVNVVGSSGDISLTSMSGILTLSLPSSFSGTFEIELDYTRNSNRNYEILSDFPLSQQESDEWDMSQGSARRTIFGSGTTGSGQYKVKLKTINGNIIIKKGVGPR
jgi:DUF4097 and DUF4098 domain-containing protein YvlB